MTDLITFFDDATGERVGLSAAEVGEWSAATAALLVEECGLGPGSRAAVLLPPHWQTATVLLGAWSAGVEVSFRGWSTAGLRPAGDELDVTFVESRRVGSWLDEVPRGRHQFVLGDGPVPEGYRDYESSVRPHFGARVVHPAAVPHAAATDDGTTFGQFDAVAAEIAETRGIRRGDRVLVDAATSEHPLIWLLAPLTAGASLVLCANLDRSRLPERIATESVTQQLG